MPIPVHAAGWISGPIAVRHPGLRIWPKCKRPMTVGVIPNRSIHTIAEIATYATKVHGYHASRQFVWVVEVLS